MRFLLALLPWLELLTLIQLGIETTALTALAYVFLTLFLGFALLKRQGQGLLEQMQRGPVLSQQLLLDDMAMGFAGLLLIIPGLITDFLALLVLLGPLRRRILRALQGKQADTGPVEEPPAGPHTIEGEFRRVDDPPESR